MYLVILESPYAGDIERNERYARDCMKDCFARGEAPFASHLLYTQPGVLDDTNPMEREMGIEAGLRWGEFADKTVVYTDLGISGGMQYGIESAKRIFRPIEYRSLSAWKAV
jgi:hypothetical protein